ncbi:FKBP-type peptidyl-prolyl cis-trans isomerase, partial [Mesorhizobium sp. M2D.F.Ca.ET.160.01.1.1]
MAGAFAAVFLGAATVASRPVAPTPTPAKSAAKKAAP